MQSVQILIIDDKDSLRQTSARDLAKAGYKVREATTGDEGLSLAQEYRPDLILVAMALPGMGGVEVCRRIKTNANTAACFVVLLSESKGPSDSQMREAGADDYLVRPVENRELIARVRTMMQLKLAEDTLQARTHALNERTKELQCVYGISKLNETPDITLEEIYAKTVTLIPLAWEFPEVTCARIFIHDQEFKTDNFTETPWIQRASISMYGQHAGYVEVGLLEKELGGEPPFLEEEHQLLSIIAERLGRIAERKQAEAALRERDAIQSALLSVTLETVILLDPEGRVLMANEHGARRLGTTPNALKRRNLYELFPPDVARSRKAHIDTVLRSGKATHFEDIRAGQHYINSIYPIFDEHNEHVIQVAIFASNITEGKSAETSLARRIRQLGLLNDVGGKIASILDLESLLTRAVHLVQEEFGYHHVALFTMGVEGDRVVMRARAGAFTELFAPDHTLNLGQGMVGWVAMHGESVLANDVDAEPRYVNLYPEILPTRSELSVPIQIGDDIVGVLDVQSPQRNAFDENDVLVIQTLASQLAIAIDNARLFAKTEHLTALNEGIVQAVPDAIVIVDTEGQIVFVNSALTTILGYLPEKVVGQSWENFFPQEQQAIVLMADELSSHGQFQRYELTLLAKDGRPVPILYSSTPWVDTETGEITGTLSVFTDIRETKKAEEELQKTMARYRTVVDYQTDLICRFQPDGVLTFVNLTYCRYFGVDREDLIGHSFLPLVMEKDREKTLQHLAAFGPKKLVATTERQVIAAGGKLRWQQWIDRPIFDEAGHLIEFQSVGRDITEQKQQGLELRKYREHLEELVETRTAELQTSREHLSRVNAELTRAARLKDEFLASMSHELRTPLTSILGMSEVLSEQVFGPLSEQQARAVQTITASGQHLLALINDILDVSKIEAGKLELDLGTVEAKAVCESALYMVKQTAHKKKLTIVTDFEQPDLSFVADHRRLKQILVNLLSNAVKFTPEGGRIGINVVKDEEKQIVNFTVWDTGIGIAEDDMARLFQPFVQLDSRLSREYNGSGLGLALVYRLAQMQGGGVSLESKLGRGSHFTVSLPYCSPQEKCEEHSPDSDMEFQCKTKGENIPSTAVRVLLAEDNEDSINTISKYLQAKNYAVTTARNGHEAVKIAREVRPDLVLMDIQMPRMDGFEAIRHLRADVEFRSVPIIALTALAMPGDRERCLETGANAYMSKPVSLKNLVKTMETYLERTKFARGME